MSTGTNDIRIYDARYCEARLLWGADNCFKIENMSEKTFQAGDAVHNTKTKRTGVVKKPRGEGVYLVSVQGFGEQEWKQADMELSAEPKTKRNHTWKRE
jgi:hypothetical protein